MLSGYCSAFHTPHLQACQFFLEMQELSRCCHFSNAFCTFLICSDLEESAAIAQRYSNRLVIFLDPKSLQETHICILLSHYNVRRGQVIHSPYLKSLSSLQHWVYKYIQCTILLLHVSGNINFYELVKKFIRRRARSIAQLAAFRRLN